MPTVLQDLQEIEYIGGQGRRKVSPKRTHAAVQGAVLKIFVRCGASRGFSGPEWRFHLSPDTSLVPDVAFVSYERLRTLSDEQAEEPPFAPDVVAEIRSPSGREGLIQEKIRLYLAHGSVLVLDVDPALRALHAHTEDGLQVYLNGDRFTCDAVPWLEFDVAELFENLEIPR